MDAAVAVVLAVGLLLAFFAVVTVVAVVAMAREQRYLVQDADPEFEVELDDDDPRRDGDEFDPTNVDRYGEVPRRHDNDGERTCPR